jgi:nucleoside-diphosphate-sugar epimerase
MYRTNVQGTRNVIGGALARGIRSIIHVSSAAALYDPAATVIDERLPPAAAGSAYAASKVAAERYVRALVEQGEPVTITYPTGVVGPNDPAMSEGNQGLKIFFDAGLIRTSSGMQLIDVRELARVHVRLLEGGYTGPWVVGGHYLEWRALNALVQRVVGKPMTEYTLPGWSLRLAGRAVDAYARWRPVDVPFTSEAMAYATRWIYVDDSKLRQALNISYRPLQQTLGDTILWLGESGHIERHWIEQMTAQD